MYLVSKKRYYFIFATVIILMTAAGIYGYLVFSGIEPEDQITLKFFAENFIFYTLLVMIFLIFLFVLTVVRSENIFRELDKVIELSRQGKYLSGNQLRKLGRLGDKIIEINAQLSSLNEMKSVKISSLSNTVNLLLEESVRPLILLDVQGKVSKVSKAVLEIFKIESKEITDLHVETIFPDFNFSKIQAELKQSKFVNLETKFKLDSFEKAVDVYLIVYPVLNYQNEVAGLVCRLESRENYHDLIDSKSTSEGQSGEKGKIAREIQDLPLFKRFSGMFRPEREEGQHENNAKR